jgi:hypothetical protein
VVPSARNEVRLVSKRRSSKESVNRKNWSVILPCELYTNFDCKKSPAHGDACYNMLSTLGRYPKKQRMSGDRGSSTPAVVVIETAILEI